MDLNPLGAQKSPINTSKNKHNTKTAKKWPYQYRELHWYKECTYICLSLRSAGWKEDLVIKAKFKK
jgi:hypothetical protein